MINSTAPHGINLHEPGQMLMSGRQGIRNERVRRLDYRGMLPAHAPKGRFGAAAILAVLCLVAAGCSSPPAVPTKQVVDVHADATTSASVTDRWSITVPPGAAGTAEAILTIAPPPDLSAGPVEGVVLATADFALSSGQPRAPITFTYRFDEPLPDGDLLYLLDDDGAAADFSAEPDGNDRPSSTRVHLAELSPDRRTATVSDIEHLSVKSWIRDSIASLTSGLGKVFRQRFDAPKCDGASPLWVMNAEFVDDPNAPMLTCVGSDPSNPNIAVVKVVNNRGTGLVLTAPVNPSLVISNDYRRRDQHLGSESPRLHFRQNWRSARIEAAHLRAPTRASG